MDLKTLPLKGQKVLIRVDFNVPLDPDGNITDDMRIKASLPTIQYVLDQGGSVILMSHLGRPKGERKTEFSLKPVAKHLEKLIGKKVEFASDCIGKKVEKLASGLKPGEILLLENLRFHKAEEKPDSDPEFAKNLAKLADVYINDAFGTAHRAHSSTTTIAQYFPGKKAAGFLLEKEIEFLGEHLQKPKHPFYAIIGGAKVSTKLGILNSFLDKVDALFIGGGMAYTFFEAQGFKIGESLLEKDLVGQAKEFLEMAKRKKIPLFFPKDIVIANAYSNEAEKKVISIADGIPDGWQGLDIGPLTIEEWNNTLLNANTIFWNGPMGVFEFPNFANGTNAIAKTLAQSNAITVIGGGDSAAAVNQLDMSKKFSHISTGGGASLEYIELGHLPGIDALN